MALALCWGMTRARQILPDKYYMLTRRCTQRLFLLRPDDITNNAFVYCLGEAAERFEIDILVVMAESNHHHTVFYDRHGRAPQFMEHFHKMLARCLNARWGRGENLWSSEEPCLTELLDRDAVIDKLVYAASNPVKDLLVDQVRQWPGTNGYVHLANGKPMTAHRPRHFFKQTGTMPEEVTLEMTIPPELGDANGLIAEVRAGVEAVEREVRARRLQTGKRVLGPRQILKQSWKSSPSSRESRRTPRPRFAGATAVRVPALLAFREFLSSYRDARKDWLAGADVQFPRGTYWLRRFARISIEPVPTVIPAA
jgi:putative transposase